MNTQFSGSLDRSKFFQFIHKVEGMDVEDIKKEAQKSLLGLKLVEKIRGFKGSNLGLLTVGKVTVLENGTPLSLGKIIRDTFWQRVPSAMFATDLDPYKRAIGTTIESTLGKYWHYKDEILEIGGGSNPITRFLPDIPQEAKNKIHLSDVSLECVKKLRQQNPHSIVHQYDVRKLSQGVKPATYKGIVMNDVLSVFIREELKSASREIFKVLETGGFLIHFSPRNSFRLGTWDEYTSDNLIVFPALNKDQSYNAIYTVKKSEFQQALGTLDDLWDMSMKKPLQEYAALTPAQREDFCETCEVLGLLDQLALLVECFENLNCQSTKRICCEEAFSQRAREELENAGFEILEFRNTKSSYIGPRVNALHPSKKHLFAYDRGIRSHYSLGVLAPGMIQEKANMHIIVARKRL